MTPPTLPAVSSTPNAATSRRTSTALSDTETLILAIYNIFQDIFTTCPDPDLRDNAYHIATHLLHGHCQRGTRLKIINGLLKTDASVAAAVSPMHEAQSGNLKSIAVDWLKDEIWPTKNVRTIMSRLADEEDQGLPVDTITELVNLVFPAESVPDILSEGTIDQQEEVLETLAADLPFYVSSLNLLCLVANSHYEVGEPSTSAADAGTVASTGESAPSAAQPSLDAVVDQGEVMLAKLEKWKEYLVDRIPHKKVSDTTDEPGSGLDGINLTDVFALEDAVGRARELLPVHTEA